MVAILHEGKTNHEQFPHIYEIVLANPRLLYPLIHNLQRENMWPFINHGPNTNMKL